ncbi:MAG: hypothetical protein ACYDHH_27230 [Solirubrobacteraceae bacterium]
MGNKSLKRMAGRMVKRAGIEGEEGESVAFGFSSLIAAIFLGVLEELGPIGDLASILAFGFHRIVLVTDQHTYVFRARPFHRPGKLLGTYPTGPGTVDRTRGKLTFPDGQVVWHTPWFAWRMKRIQGFANASYAH